MAERKTSAKRAPKRERLDALLEQDRQAGVSESVMEEQRISFAYGNAPKGSRITKDSARSASKSVRLVAA